MSNKTFYIGTGIAVFFNLIGIAYAAIIIAVLPIQEVSWFTHVIAAANMIGLSLNYRNYRNWTKPSSPPDWVLKNMTWGEHRGSIEVE